MPLFYFDIETTGLDPTKDRILTVQYQKIDMAKGRTTGPLQILKVWDEGHSEKNIISLISPFLMESNPWKFVSVGNNLIFDFKFLAAKLQQHFSLDVDTMYFLMRPHIDLKHVMILLNGGKFKGYNHILGKQESGENIALWYNQCEYDKIINYIKNEAAAFTKLCSKLRELLPNLFYKRLDSYV